MQLFTSEVVDLLTRWIAGAGRDIPSQATLHFEVECVDIRDSNAPKAPKPNVFAEIDSNHDHAISYDEFEAWFRARDKEVPRGLWEKEDKNADKAVSWEEFTGPKGDKDPNAEL